MTDNCRQTLLQLAMEMVCSGDGHVIPEILGIMDADTFLNLVLLVNGRYIRIPAKAELLKSVKTLLYFQYTKLEGKTEEEACKILKITGYEKRWYDRHIKAYLEHADKCNLNIPEEFDKNFIEKLGQLYEELEFYKDLRK